MRFTCSICLTTLLGAVGGAILGYPFVVIGSMSGAVFSFPIATLFGYACYKKHLSIIIISFAQLVFAVGLGLLKHHDFQRNLAIHWPLLGQLLGGFLGCAISWRWRRDLLGAGYCCNCQYDLTGLTEPRCPECGTPFEMSSKSEDVINKPESNRQDATVDR